MNDKLKEEIFEELKEKLLKTKYVGIIFDPPIILEKKYSTFTREIELSRMYYVNDGWIELLTKNGGESYSLSNFDDENILKVYKKVCESDGKADVIEEVNKL